MADREVSDGRGKVFERGTHWYGLVQGDGQGKKKSGGQHQWEKGQKQKK
jgi:hypothetical protein